MTKSRVRKERKYFPSSDLQSPSHAFMAALLHYHSSSLFLYVRIAILQAVYTQRLKFQQITQLNGAYDISGCNEDFMTSIGEIYAYS